MEDMDLEIGRILGAVGTLVPILKSMNRFYLRQVNIMLLHTHKDITDKLDIK